MTLDLQLCSRARLARDARFDGKFYIAVLTTRIYCRPICRSRTSLEKNVRYFPTAAAAAEAGFRPCLRCRPECSPGTAAWAGTKNTVSRALRLINESGLEEGGIEALAAHLGLGSRHLRRLFLRHLGASPRAVAQTRRLHFAKKLIDDTALSMTQIAIAAGFGSVRRFNAAVHKVYGRTPTELRARMMKKIPAQPDNQYLFQLDYRPPYAWREMLAALRAQATPGTECVADDAYRRTVTVNGVQGHVEVRLSEERHALDVRVNIEEPRSLFLIIERIRAMFDLDADWPTIERVLKADPALAPRVRAFPGMRVAGCWSGFELAVHAILTPAGSPVGALVAVFGARVDLAPGLTHLFPTAEVLAEADLQRAGLGRLQSLAVRTLARAVRDGRIGFEKVADPDAVLRELAAMPGFTPAALEYVAMRALREPDAFPMEPHEVAGALGLDAANSAGPEVAADIERRTSAWRPWRAYAAAYLADPAADVPQASLRISRRKSSTSASEVAYDVTSRTAAPSDASMSGQR
jgi:AraC family transcriptional regulator, regulatory protein of adaptative response / DNA-3-methyladenine glycosylase II